MNIAIVGGSVFAFAFGSLLLFCTLYILNDWKAKRLGKKGEVKVHSLWNNCGSTINFYFSGGFLVVWSWFNDWICC